MQILQIRKGKRHFGLILNVFCFVFFGFAAHAQTHAKPNAKADPYYQMIGSHSEFSEEIDSDPALSRTPLSSYPSDHPFLMPESDLMTGLTPWAIAEGAIKLWDIILDNKAVVKSEFKGGSALPEGADGDWAKLAGWRPERTVLYHYVATNGYKQNVVDLTYKVSLRYGGRYRGRGQYIASARVVPIHIVVLWGFKLSVQVNVASVKNESEDDEKPIASLRLHVTHKIKNPIRSSSEKQSYYVKGDGYIEDTQKGHIYHESPSEVPTE